MPPRVSTCGVMRGGRSRRRCLHRDRVGIWSERRWRGALFRQRIMSKIHDSTPSAAGSSPPRRVDAYMWCGGTTDAGRCAPHTLESASGRIVGVGLLSVKTSFRWHTRRVPHGHLELAHIPVCPPPTRHDGRAPHTRCALVDARPRARLHLARDAVRVAGRAPRCATGGDTKLQELQGKPPVHTPTCGVQTCTRAATMKHKKRQPRTTVCYAQTERVGVGDQHPVMRMACRPPNRFRHGMGAGEKRVTV